jgi:hypothetical protein
VFTIAAVTSRARAGDAAPLYVAEYVAADDPTIQYALVVPVGALPTREVRLVPMIECNDVLRDGPVEGVKEERDADGALRACYADSQNAVREAARRALVERLGDVFAEDAVRFVYVGPAAPHAASVAMLSRRAYPHVRGAFLSAREELRF